MKKTNNPESYAYCPHCGYHHLLKGRYAHISRDWQAFICAIDSADTPTSIHCNYDPSNTPCKAPGFWPAPRNLGRLGRWLAGNLRAAYRIQADEAKLLLGLWKSGRRSPLEAALPDRKRDGFIPKRFKLGQIINFYEYRNAEIIDHPRWATIHEAIQIYTSMGALLYFPGKISQNKKGEIIFIPPRLKRLE